jgi:hypothetical protein
MGGKGNWEQRVYINNAIQDDLTWAINHLEHFDGVHLLKSSSWNRSLADFTIYCDACPERMGFWYPVSKDGFYAPTPITIPSNAMFYLKEALCVVSALKHIQTKAKRGSKILIYTDNTNTVDIFQTLLCLPPYNPLLKTAVDIIMCNKYSLHVLHISGDQNIIADALSRVHFSVALQIEPNLTLFSFHPPGLVGSSL